jgi:hypothetical protein
LENETDIFPAVLRELYGREACDLVSVEKNPPLCRGIHSSDKIEECGFSRSAFSQEDDAFPVLYLQVDVHQGKDFVALPVVKTFAYMYEVQERFHCLSRMESVSSLDGRLGFG